MKTYRDIEKRDFERLQRNHDALLAALEGAKTLIDSLCDPAWVEGNEYMAITAAIRQARGETI